MKTPVAKWVPRKNLSRKPKSAEAMELDKEEKAWQHQLYRARQAKERAEVRQALKDRQKEIERANELEERSGEGRSVFSDLELAGVAATASRRGGIASTASMRPHESLHGRVVTASVPHRRTEAEVRRRRLSGEESAGRGPGTVR